MRTAQVILDIPTQAFDNAFTYSIPNKFSELVVGCCVVVPFGGRKALAYVVDINEWDISEEAFSNLVIYNKEKKKAQKHKKESKEACATKQLSLVDMVSNSANQAKQNDLHESNNNSYLEALNEQFKAAGIIPEKLKEIEEQISTSYFDRDAAQLACDIAREYIAPLSAAIRLFLPPGAAPRMVKRGLQWCVEKPAVKPVDDRWVRITPAAADFEPRKSAVKQKAILKALSEGELRIAELSMELGAVSSSIKSLEKKGVVETFKQRRMRTVESSIDDKFTPSKKPQLLKDQACAVDAISGALDEKSGRVVLVDGVTGSGKTEVYLQAIEYCLKQGKSALVLVPEISLTPQTVARFRGRFGDTVAVLHSKMSNGERYDQWDIIQSGHARVVVGARSALFAPLKNVGLIVIDEEHESSYKQDQAPRYDARRVACWIAQRKGGVVVLGSATPSIESLYKAEHDQRWVRVCLPERANKKPMPPIELIDMAAEFSSGARCMFSHHLQTALFKTIEDGHKTVLLLNQRGFAQFLLCRDCGFVPMCSHCDTSLTYHETTQQLICHHCGYTERVMPRCPECKSPYLKRFGAGTQRVEAELRSLLSEHKLDIPIVRMDADTTKGKGAHRKLLEEFAAYDCAILLGTQMVAKGLDFDDVTLVGVINADTQLNLPDFRAAERTFDLIEQVAGRAGRSDLPGKVLVQTYNVHAVPIVAAARYNRDYFLKDDLEKRKLLKYPPYVRMVNILLWGKQEARVKEEGQNLFYQLYEMQEANNLDDWTIYPATPCVLSKLRGVYRYHIAIKLPASCDMAEYLAPFFKERKPSLDVSVAVDVDPVSLL